MSQRVTEHPLIFLGFRLISLEKSSPFGLEWGLGSLLRLGMASSDDIKQWLVEKHLETGVRTRASEWKRLKKSKNADGQVAREFSHPTVGKVTVVETPAGLVLSPGPTSGSAFTAPVFTPASLAAARSVLDDYQRALWEEREGEGDSSEWLRQQPLFLEAFPALPTLFTFSFPHDTYGNESGGRGVDGDATDLCILVKGKDQDDPHYMTVDLFAERLRALGMEAEDEYHWALQTSPCTVREWVTRLMGLGLAYDPTDCIFSTELIALGATRPAPGQLIGPTQPVHAQFQKAVRNDDVVTIAGLLGGTDASGEPVEANDGAGKTWVESAFENQAWNTVSLLLANDAPMSRKGLDTRIWEYNQPWHSQWLEDPERTQSLLQLLMLSNGWNPEDPLPVNCQRFDEKGGLERDAWAKTVVMGSWTEEHAQWVHQAWDLLADRVGVQPANDSFTRAWLTMDHRKTTQEFTQRVMDALAQDVSPLNDWPSRAQPRPWQALATLADRENTFSWAVELAKQLNANLPAVLLEDGTTVLDRARAMERRARENAQRNQGGFEVVMVYRDGTRTTRTQEDRQAWKRRQRILAVLEGWSTATTGPKPGR